MTDNNDKSSEALRAEEKARQAMRDLVDGKRLDVQVVRYEVLDALDRLRSRIVDLRSALNLDDQESEAMQLMRQDCSNLHHALVTERELIADLRVSLNEERALNSELHAQITKLKSLP